MDTPFDVIRWQPTKPPEPGDAELSAAYISKLAFKLSQQTIDISKHPYDPNAWLRRSITLSRLRYPELAVGDSHKAKLLCQANLSRLEERNGWSLGNRMAFWMQDGEAMTDERVELLKDHLRDLLDRASSVESEHTELSMEDPEGRFRRRPYPWMPDRYCKRSDELVTILNRDFAESHVDENQEPYLVIKRHAFGQDVGGSDTSELLGVFAALDIPQGEVVLIDTTNVWGCNGPGTNGDYLNLYGGRGCYDPIHPNADSDDTHLDFRWIRDKAGKHACSILRNCRLLLRCVEDGSDHPLDHPIVARLTPNYPKDTIDIFAVADDISIPNEALQQMGVDIFAESKYDTWVLFTVEARADNNCYGDPIASSLGLLFSLFNHSCSPNLDWTVSEDHRTVTVESRRDVSQGEQLFVEYDNFIGDQPLEIRRNRLWGWLDGPCRCERCIEEEKVLGSDYYDRSATTKRAEWDCEEKPVFPEDALRLKN